jgi:hypothetical protein
VEFEFEFKRRRLAAVEKERAEERERFRDLEERLLRTEQFADQTLAAQNRLEADATRLQDDLAVSHRSD